MKARFILMTSKQEIRRRRDGPVSAKIGISAGDKILLAISRADGLYAVSRDKVVRVNLPDDADPAMEYPDAPTTQTLILNKGSRDPIVARTVLQAKDFAQYLGSEDIKRAVLDVAWEVMLSLLSFAETVDWLEKSIDEKQKFIASDLSKYVSGDSPPPLPIVDGLELRFRSGVLTSNHILNAISELFPILLDCGSKFQRGRFDIILKWTETQYGADDLLATVLRQDHRWINVWREVRNALEHPTKDYYVKINNFRLLSNRQVQLPTWQLKHSQHPDLIRPQAMVEALRTHQNNILTFFENLLMVVTDKAIKLPFPIVVTDIEESRRNPECPKRYKLGLSLTNTRKTSS